MARTLLTLALALAALMTTACHSVSVTDADTGEEFAVVEAPQSVKERKIVIPKFVFEAVQRFDVNVQYSLDTITTTWKETPGRSTRPGPSPCTCANSASGTSRTNRMTRETTTSWGPMPGPRTSASARSSGTVQYQLPAVTSPVPAWSVRPRISRAALSIRLSRPVLPLLPRSLHGPALIMVPAQHL